MLGTIRDALAVIALLGGVCLVAGCVSASGEADALVAGCTNHPGRNAIEMRFQKQFCAQCIQGINRSVAETVAKNPHVEPKDCFVQYNGGDSWSRIDGTGCAHWVAHKLTLPRQGFACLDEKTVKVADITDGLTQVPNRAGVAVDDVWVGYDGAQGHCGVVVEVVPGTNTAANKITIEHDSSRQGGVKKNDFDSYFGGAGTFWRR